jgi:hypothetical protein
MKKNSLLFRIVLIVMALLIAGIGAMLVFYKPLPKHRSTISQTETQTTDQPSKPVFRKDGELRFMDNKSGKEISLLNVEVADDNAERAQGLMYRDTMPENAGMLFFMETEEIQSFWMKNTILSLDIIFVNSDKHIVSIHQNCKPYSLDQIISEKPALYVVEVNAGYTNLKGIKTGDQIVF